MENKINLAELLKDCPKGMELDCIIWDNEVKVFLKRVLNDDFAYPIEVTIKYNNTECTKSFTKYGAFNDLSYCKCIIFPKGKTTWEGFVPPCKFKDGDILCNSKTKQPFILNFFDLLNNNIHSYCGIDGSNKFYTSSNNWAYASDVRLATEEEKEKLFQAIKDNSYRWNAETKTLKKLPKFKVGDRIRHKTANEDDMYEISKVYDDSYGLVNFTCKLDMKYQDNYELVPNKFDVNTLVPFESKVLVRAADNQFWRPAIWGVKHRDWDFCCVVGGEMWEQCIPYKGNEHLLGTTDNCDEYYKTWE